MKSSLILLSAVVCLVTPAVASVDNGPYGLSTVSIATPDRGLILQVRPDGSGPPFTEARSADGGLCDATITVRVMDYLNRPVAHFARQDIWLQPLGGDLVVCGGQAVLLPDADSDADGYVHWARPPRAGGFSEVGVIVEIDGWAMPYAPLDLVFISPDLDGSGRVDLVDAGQFTSILYGDYASRADFNCDGAINVSDSGHMASALGAQCP